MGRCRCICHQHVRADYNDAYQHDVWSVASELALHPYVNVARSVQTDSVVEAAVASGCSCVNNHCAVFEAPIDKRAGLPAPVTWTPENDTQADGETGG